ncbi:MAG: chloride channel protein [Chromatiales bacterium]|jgi:H+/Cl- antiporter ClcA
MYQHIRRSKRRLFSPKAWKIRLVFWLGAILVGLICALFAELAEFANGLFLNISKSDPLLPLLLTPLALVGIAWVTKRFFPGSEGSGIPQTVAALEIADKPLILSLRIAFGKILLTVGGLMSGASIGREGPSVHIGASIMYSLGRYVRFPPHYMERGLILAGGAAGVAAAFNTPLAGIVFAIEEMNRTFEQRISGMVTTAVVLAGITAIVVLGQYHYFGHSSASMPSTPLPWLAIPVLGIIGGAIGGLFATLLIQSTRKIAPIARSKPLLVALLAGLALALINFYSDYSSSGTGYQEAQAIIDESGEFDPWYPVAKFSATLASYLTGIPGGIFAPSLATGAGIGANLGHWLPIAPLSVMIMLGMVAYFTGVVQAPLTALIIVMEMTNNHDMILALMSTAFIAYGTSHLVCPKPLYAALAEAFIRRSAQK